jgi:tetratricopeptide (TPR) repeat protein
MKLGIISYCILICLTVTVPVFELNAQSNPDTLTLAKSLRDKGLLTNSIDLLNHYVRNNPNDLNGKWLLAQATFYAKDFKKSKRLYNEAIALDPSNKVLRLDYAKTLTEMGETVEAEALLNEIVQQEPGNAEAWYTLARITWWGGKSKAAIHMLDNIIRNAPNFKAAQTLHNEILKERLPWVRMNAMYRTDDQPLPFAQIGLEGGKSISTLLNPDVNLYFPTALPDGDVLSYQGLKLGNTFIFKQGKTKLYVNAGLIQHASNLGTDWTGRLQIQQKLKKYWLIGAEVNRNPYFSTMGSLNIKLAEEHAGLSVAFDKPGSWNGKLSGGISRFSVDDNMVRSVSGWLFAPELKVWKLKAGLGAGFNYSDSDTNLYVSDKTIAEFYKGNSTNSNKKINGVYDPYFTPENQQVVSLLLNINYAVSKKITLNAKLNYGVLASSDYPYLFPDSLNGAVVFVREFIKKDFNPMEAGIQADWKIRDNLALSLRYTYSETIFYASHYAGFTLTKRLGHAK